MAIKEQKLPNPQEVKTNPQRFTDEELKTIRELRDNLTSLTHQMGELCLNRIKLEEAEGMLKDALKTLEDKESTLAKTLSDKYGKGSIDIETGTFTPS